MRKEEVPLKTEKLRRQVKELEVLNIELMSLKSTAKVYKQYGSGQVLFLVNKEKVVNDCKGVLRDVKQKLENAEKEFTHH